MMTQEHVASEKAQLQPQNDSDITEDYSQLLGEGYVYDNEDLVVAQLNAAYSAAGIYDCHTSYLGRTCMPFSSYG